MTVQELAEFYLRPWYQDSGNWHLADNAPTSFWRFVYSLPKHTDRNLVHSALTALATKKAPPDPTKAQIMSWLDKYPTAYKRCDEVLNAKGAKITKFETLLTKAYNSEMFLLTDIVHQFLLNQINQHK